MSEKYLPADIKDIATNIENGVKESMLAIKEATEQLKKEVGEKSKQEVAFNKKLKEELQRLFREGKNNSEVRNFLLDSLVEYCQNNSGALSVKVELVDEIKKMLKIVKMEFPTDKEIDKGLKENFRELFSDLTDKEISDMVDKALPLPEIESKPLPTKDKPLALKPEHLNR